MKICSFNINSIRARKELILDWLAKRGQDLDVLLFQELKTEEPGFPEDEFKSLGYASVIFGQKTYNGVAICSKLPVTGIQLGFHDPYWDQQKRILLSEIKGMTFINVYAPHGGPKRTEKFDYKIKWFGFLLDFLKDRFSPDDHLIIGGDFNIAPEDIDVFSPEKLDGAIGTLPEEREALRRLIEWGLHDVFRHLYPNEVQFTWWDYQTAAIWRDEGMRIDAFLATRKILSQVKRCEVDLWPRRRRTPTPSDHAPLIVELAD